MQHALLCGLVAVSLSPFGLTANGVSASPYHIVVISGQGAMTSVHGSFAPGPVIEVEDQNDRPVKGAYVTFSIPTSGTRLSFANGSMQFSTITGDSGRAAADGLKVAHQTGQIAILVKAAYQGQVIGPVNISDANSSGKAAELWRNLQSDTAAQNVGNLAPGVLGVATGPEFKLNGTVVPDNANLMLNAEVASLDKTVTIDLKDGCDYLLAPNSLVKIEDHKLILESGKVRARHFGTCKVGAGNWTVGGDTPGADGVVSYSGANLQVGSLTGTLQVTGAQGALAGTVAPGGYASFGGTAQAGASGASGASAGGPSGASASTGAAGGTTPLLLYTGALAATLGGLGLAVDAILQPANQSTSP